MQMTLTEIYDAKVASGVLRPDPAQHAVLPVLQDLRLWLEANATRKVGLFAGLFAKPLTPLLISAFAFNFNNFVLISLLTDGRPDYLNTKLPAGTTDILVSYTYRIAFRDSGSDFGLAAAISTLIFVMVAIMALPKSLKAAAASSWRSPQTRSRSSATRSSATTRSTRCSPKWSPIRWWRHECGRTPRKLARPSCRQPPPFAAYGPGLYRRGAAPDRGAWLRELGGSCEDRGA